MFGSKCLLCGTNQIVSNGQCINRQTCGANQVSNNGVCICISGYALYNGVCYQSCGTTSIIINGQCVNIQPCGQNEIRDNTGACVCASGYSRYNGACYQNCGTNSVYVNGQCINIQPCGQNMVRNNAGVCVCASGFTLFNGVCYITCGTNAIILNNQCVCIPGYSFVAASNSCQLPTPVQCTTNYVVINGVCVCPQGYGIINNNCLVCPGNSFVDGSGNCVCNQGYTLNTTTLTCVQACFANAYRNSFGDCVCNNGYYRQGNLCIPQGTCTGGLVWNGSHCVCPNPQVTDAILGGCTYCNTAGRMVSNGQCVCSQTYYPTSNGCVPCIANSYYNSTQNTCVCNTNYVLINGVCTLTQQCPANSQWSPTFGRCVCNVNGHYVINGICQPCPSNSAWSGTQCVCNTGFTMTSAGLCTRECVNATWNGNTCVCWSGYYIISGVCQQCDINSAYSNTQFTCVCNEGYYGTWNNCQLCATSCKTCSGPATTQCLTCNVGVPVNGVCSNSCGTGQYLDSNNICQACTANCDLCYAANSCTTCAAGYTRRSVNSGGTTVTTCEAPSPTASHVISLRGNVLGNGLIYQGVALNAMPTTILSAGCSICNDLLTVEVNSLFTGITVTQEFIANSLYWFVITFSFTSSSAVPTFEYTVRLNPAHASHFTAQDMTQTLTGSFSSSAFPTQAAPTAMIQGFRSGPTVGGVTFGGSGGVPQSAISQIFGG